MEADLRLLNKKLRKADVKMSDFKNEETRLILSNKTLKKSSEKHQREAHRLLFSITKKEHSVSYTNKKKAGEFRALEVKLEKVVKENKKSEKINKILKTENEALASNVTVIKAEMDLKKEAIKMDLAKITLDRQVMNNKAKIRAKKQKADLALEHLNAKMASAQAKKDADAAHKEQVIEKKHDEFEKRKHCSNYFGSDMVSFTFC